MLWPFFLKVTWKASERRERRWGARILSSSDPSWSCPTLANASYPSIIQQSGRSKCQPSLRLEINLAKQKQCQKFAKHTCLWWRYKNKLQKLEDALVKQMLTSAKCANLWKLRKGCEKCSKVCKRCKNQQYVQNCEKRAKVCIICKIVQHMQSYAKCAKLCKIC